MFLIFLCLICNTKDKKRIAFHPIDSKKDGEMPEVAYNNFCAGMVPAFVVATSGHRIKPMEFTMAVMKKAAVKKPAAKKPAAKKPAAKKTIVKKPVAKKTIAKKPAAKKTIVKKAVAKRPAAKKPVAKKK